MSITVADLVAKLSLDGTGFNKGVDEAEKKTSSFGEKVGAAGTKMTAFATVPIVGFLGAATKAAAEDEAAQANLAQALQTSVGASDAVVKSVEGYIGSVMKATTFTDDELRPAFRDLVTVSGDVGKAQDLLAVAMDVAARKGIPLETATKAVAKASEGQFAAVNKLVPGLVDLEDKSLTAEGAVDALAKTFAGSASAATETAAGKAKMMTRDMGEMTEQIGGALVPILGALVGAIRPLIDWFTGLSDGQMKVLVGVLGLVAAIGPMIKIVQSVITVIKALQAAMAFLAANPIVLVVVAIAALVAALVLAYKHCETFRNIVDAVFNFVGDFISTVMSGVSSIIGDTISTIKSVWETVWGAVETTIDTVWSAIQTIVETTIGVVESIIDTILGAIETLWGGTWDTIKAVAETVWDGIKLVIDTTFGTIKTIIDTTLGAIKTAWETIWNGVKAFAETIWAGIKAVVEGTINGVKAVIEGVMGAIKAVWEGVWNGVKAFVETVWGLIKGVVDREINGIKAIIDAVLGVIRGIWDGMWNGLKAAFSTTWGAIKGVVSTTIGEIRGIIDGIVGFVGGLGGRIRGAAGGMWDGIKEAFKSAINAIIRFWNGLQFKIPGFDVGPISFGGFTLGVPDLPMMAKGGPLEANQMALVGEKGPELFVPKVAGTILPNHALAGSGNSLPGKATTVIVKVTVQGSVVTERDLVDAVYEGLKQKERYRGTLAFR